ncbi:MAG: hypothetical protein LDL31_03980 [Prosthecobacter sp.]|jgi:vacuolar-type H+-ATPase subunit I/STV1|nr:hypothetical protein [Prosthecobacter sp.]
MKNIIALLLFAGGMSAWYFYHQLHEAELGLTAVQQQLADLEKSSAPRRAEYKAAGSVKAIKEKINAKKAELKTAQEKVQALEHARQQVLAEKAALLAALRQVHVGREFKLVLSSGRNLGQVRILKIEDSGLSIATTSGVTKVLPGELPQELRSALFLTQ